MFQVHVLPPQAAQLANPKPREQVEDDPKGCRFRCHTRGSDQPLFLIPGQHPHLLLDALRQPDVFYDIGYHQPVLHCLTEGHVQHVAHIGQCLWGKAAGLAHIPLCPPLIEKVLQFLGREGVQVFVPDLGLDVGADVEFITAIGGEFYGRPGVFLQPAIHPLPHRDSFLCHAGNSLPGGSRLDGIYVGSGVRFSLEPFGFALPILGILINPGLVLGLIEASLALFPPGYYITSIPLLIHCLTWSRERMIRLPIRRQGNSGRDVRR